MTVNWGSYLSKWSSFDDLLSNSSNRLASHRSLVIYFNTIIKSFIESVYRTGNKMSVSTTSDWVGPKRIHLASDTIWGSITSMPRTLSCRKRVKCQFLDAMSSDLNWITEYFSFILICTITVWLAYSNETIVQCMALHLFELMLSKLNNSLFQVDYKPPTLKNQSFDYGNIDDVHTCCSH